MVGFLRRHVLPWTVWLGAMSTAGWIWYDTNMGSARGYVEGVVYTVAAPSPARVTSVLVTSGQHVTAGQVIATLDDHVLDAEIQALDAERRRIEAELGAVTALTAIQIADETRGIEESVGEAELARVQAKGERSVAGAELSALDDQIKEMRELVEKRMADRRDLAELLVQRAALREQQTAATGLIRQLDTQAARARARRESLPADATTKVTDPLFAELKVVKAQMDVFAVQKEALTLRAPGDGEITSVLLRPGEVAVEGAIVATIAAGSSPNGGGVPQVVACTTEQDGARVQVGERVRLKPLDGSVPPLNGHVERLAAEVGALPIRCWRDSRITQWGRPIYIAVDDPVPLLQGQSVAIEFTGEVSSFPAAVAAPAVAASTPSTTTPTKPPAKGVVPKPIVVPGSLAARTRFEPSGIVWSAARERYIVVSDDTGLADTTEHAPWVFTMDTSGNVDADPIVIDGIKGFSDIESIAATPDGGLWLLTSQSVSKKGKRPAARQFFGKVELTASSARATGSVQLAKLLDASTLAALGLPDSNALDIEGMTATATGGLLLGLKGPVDGKGAPVWHMADPDRVLGSGAISPGDLALWGHVPLTVRADGASVRAGISDLLELPGGQLLVTATAAGATDPRSQDGALFVVDDRSKLASPRLLWTFPGLKPEGVALGAKSDALVLVFDAGAATPQWMEQPWPAP